METTGSVTVLKQAHPGSHRGFNSLLRFFGHIFGPSPGTVQHTQDPNAVARDAIGDDIERAGNNQLPRLLDAAGTATMRKLRQGFDPLPDAVIDGDGGLWAVGFDVVEDGVAVGLREDGPLHPNTLPRLNLALRGGSSLGEVRFDLLLWDARARVAQRLLHLGAEPRVVRGGVIG